MLIVIIVKKKGTAFTKKSYSRGFDKSTKNYLFYILMFSLYLSFTRSRDPYPIGTVTVGSGVNIRTGPSTGFQKVGTIPGSGRTYITGGENDWWKVSYNGIEGYISSEFVSVPAVCKASGGLNIRSGASTGYDIIGSIPENEKIEVTKRVDDDWYRIKYGETEGFAASKYIELFIAGPPVETGKVSDDDMKELGFKNYNVDEINQCLERFKIDTISRQRHFLAQAMYLSKKGLVYEEKTSGDMYEFMSIYGNSQEGDGAKYKGAGAFQVRGKFIYKEMSKYFKDNEILEKGSSIVASKYNWLSAGFLWEKLNMNELCDKETVTVEEVTHKLNNDYKGLDYIKKCYNEAANIWK